MLPWTAGLAFLVKTIPPSASSSGDLLEPSFLKEKREVFHRWWEVKKKGRTSRPARQEYDAPSPSIRGPPAVFLGSHRTASPIALFILPFRARRFPSLHVIDDVADSVLKHRRGVVVGTMSCDLLEPTYLENGLRILAPRGAGGSRAEKNDIFSKKLHSTSPMHRQKI